MVYFNFSVVDRATRKQVNKGKRVLRLISYFRAKLGTGKYCSIRRMEYPEFQTGKFCRMESAPCKSCVLSARPVIPKQIASLVNKNKRFFFVSKTLSVLDSGQFFDQCKRFFHQLFVCCLTKIHSVSQEVEKQISFG